MRRAIFRDWAPQAEPVAAALPDARIGVLDGQGHAADVVAPELVAERLLALLREPRTSLDGRH